MRRLLLLFLGMIAYCHLSAQNTSSLVAIEVNYMAAQAGLSESEHEKLFKIYSDYYEAALTKAKIEQTILNTDITSLNKREKEKMVDKWKMACTLASDAEIKYSRQLGKYFSETKQLKLIKSQSEIHTKLLNEWQNRISNEKK